MRARSLHGPFLGAALGGWTGLAEFSIAHAMQPGRGGWEALGRLLAFDAGAGALVGWIGLLLLPLLCPGRAHRTEPGMLLTALLLAAGSATWLATRPALAGIPPLLRVALALLLVGILLRGARRFALGTWSWRIGSFFTPLGAGLGLVLLGGLGLLIPHLPRLFTPAPPPGARPPNLILVCESGVSAQRFSCYGALRPTSPTADTLASEGLLFENAHTPSADRAVVHRLLHGTLPSELRHRGYDCAWIAGGGPPTSSFLGPRNADYAFLQDLDAPPLWTHMPWTRSVHRLLRLLGAPAPTSPGIQGTFHLALRWLDLQRRSDPRPFFLFLELRATAPPFRPPLGLATRFFPAAPDPADLPGLPRDPERCVALPPDGPAGRRAATALAAFQDAALLATDRALGDFLQALRDRDLLEDSLVVLTSDVGSALGQHGAFGSAAPLSAEITQVPLILRMPRALPAGTQVPALVSLEDLPASLETFLQDPSAVMAVAPHAAAPPLFAAARGGPGRAFLRCGDPRTQRITLRTPTEEFLVMPRGPNRYVDLRADPKERSLDAAPSPEEATRAAALAERLRRIEGEGTAGE